MGAQQRVRRVRRLGRQHVEAGAGDPALVKRLVQRVEVDDGAARGVDQDRMRRHGAQRRGVDHAMRLLRQRRVQAQHVARRQKVAQLIHPTDAERDLLPARHVGVVGLHLQPEGLGAQRRRRADAAEPKDAEHRTAQPAHQWRGEAVEAADRVGAQRVVVGGQAALERQHQGDGVIRHLRRAVVRRVAYRDACNTGRLQVDVVVADAAADDNHAARQPGDGGRVHRRLVPGQHGIAAAIGLLWNARPLVRPVGLETAEVAGDAALHLVVVGVLGVGDEDVEACGHVPESGKRRRPAPRLVACNCVDQPED